MGSGMNYAQDSIEGWLKQIIGDFLMDSSENTLKDPLNEKAWDGFLLGFSSGDDPLYDDYKRHVGPFHWTPSEIFSLTYPDLNFRPGDLAVISWILPQREKVKHDNREVKTYPAERWVRSRIFGEKFNQKLRGHVVASLAERGYEAVSPMLSPFWERRVSDKYGYASTWSERHAAYASGLGTFGLSDGLITPVGKAMRAGSVVAKINIPPTPRPYTDHHAYCLFFSHGICGKCITRCPVGAITEKGHDKENCREHVKVTVGRYVKSNYGFDGYGCGLCQTGVPCESKIPIPDDVEKELL